MSTNQPGAIIGLTGGIATGKSTAARFFESEGVVVIDADYLSRQIVAPGEPALDEIVDAFGEEVLQDDGTLDRTALGDIIFRDPSARETLEGITHPRIAEAMFDRARQAFDQGHRWVLYEAALLVETKTHRFLDALIVVDCSPETQKTRLQQRDEFSPEDAQRRIDSQMPLSKKRKAADYIINNDGSTEDTREQVRQIKRRIDELLRHTDSARPPRDDHA